MYPQEQQQYYQQDYQEISIFEIIELLWQNKLKIIGIVFLSAALGAAYAILTSENIYESKITFKDESASSGSSSLAALTGSIPFAGALGVKGGGAETLMFILKSRYLREQVVEKLDLYDYYIEYNEIDLTELEEDEYPTFQKVVDWLDKNVVNIKFDDELGLYTITAKLVDDDVMAAKLVRTYFEELDYYLKTNKNDRASRREEYLTKQIELIEGNIKENAAQIKELEMKYNTADLIKEASALASIVAELRQNIEEKEARLITLREVVGSNLETRVLEKEIEQLRLRLTQLMEGTPAQDFLYLNAIPALKLILTELQREVDANTNLYKALRINLEEARLERINDSSVLSVIDDAIVPEKPEPKGRMLTLAISIVLGGMIAVFYVFADHYMREGYERYKKEKVEA